MDATRLALIERLPCAYPWLANWRLVECPEEDTEADLQPEV